MLLTLTTTHRPATDLGFLLRKNPARAQRFELPFGEARVFYPEAGDERCTCALQVVVDPVGLVRKKGGPSGDRGALDQYVNDRPYAASSFLSVAIARVFDSALSGRSKERPDLVEVAQPLKAVISALPCGGDGDFIRRLFEPLGYHIEVTRAALDETFPEWGASRYHRVELSGTLPLHMLLSHLYVLIPVLDGDKHYWVGDDEVEKLLRHGEGWLATHPEREAIARRYLKHRRSLVDGVLSQLVEEPAPDDAAAVAAIEEEKLEAPISLHEQRLGTVLAALKASGAASVLDLGCGEGRLLRLLLGERQFARITGMDVSHRALEIAADRLHIDRMPPAQRARLHLLHGSLMYRDARLEGHEAAAVVEVIEHLDPPRLAAFERVLFECARPAAVVLTTPNRDYNPLFPTLPAGHLRHRDHRFEWTRDEFVGWCRSIEIRFGYTHRILPIGPEDSTHGAPSQMAIFTLDRPSSDSVPDPALLPAKT
jgi:3' terminal RNA ribose 2'-O-methyltransferase Hen1